MNGHAFAVRGVGYDAGVVYERDFDSRPDWDTAAVREDLRAIRDRLGCTTVLVTATGMDRLLDTGRIAGEGGLGVWLQPRLFEGTRAEVAEHLTQVAGRAESLRAEFPDVSLNIGCELSLSTRGFTPGRTFESRGALLAVSWPLLPLVNLRLRSFLGELVAIARQRFGGALSYGAGEWERPDWRLFDVVGLDSYREATNRWRFADDLRRTVAREHEFGRPVYVFEFGTCAYAGAAERASQAAGHVLREVAGELRVRDRAVRDEEVQAAYLDELFDLFAAVEVDGVFVYCFSEPAFVRSDEPGRDLDLGSYGIVAVTADGSWQPKQAFGAVARRYGGTG